MCCRGFAAEDGAGGKKSFLSHSPGQGILIESFDLKIKPAVTYVFQGAANANKGRGSGLHDAWRAELDIIKEFGEWGEAKVRFENGNGRAATKYITAYSNVDYNMHESEGDIEAHTFWYKQFLFGKQVTVVTGRLDPTDWYDLNNYANDHRRQYLADIFNNSTAIDWPINDSFGVHAEAAPESVKFMQFAFDYFDADRKDIFRHEMFTWGVNIRPDYLFGKDPEEASGNYRLSGWISNTPHPKLIEGGISRTDADNDNYGINLSCDQKVNDIFGVFGRFGWQRPDVADTDGDATVEWLWSLGANMNGKYWRREKDVLAVAVGQLFPSRDFKDAGNPGSAEGHFELYYNCKINDYLSITPDIQLIWNPYGNSSDGTIFIYGARAQVYF